MKGHWKSCVCCTRREQASKQPKQQQTIKMNSSSVRSASASIMRPSQNLVTSSKFLVFLISALHMAQISADPTPSTTTISQQQFHEASKIKQLLTSAVADSPATAGHKTQIQIHPHPSPTPASLLTTIEPSATTTTSRQSTSSPSPATDPMTTRSTTVDSSGWIESILIKVEDISINEEQQKQRLLEKVQKSGSSIGGSASQDDADESGAGSVSSPSISAELYNVPTDSGEDPLELSNVTLLTPTDDADTTRTERPTAAAAAAPSVESLNETDEELRAVESNNVSSLVQAADSAAASQQANSIIIVSDTEQAISCDQAYTRCALREACAPALKAYQSDCQDLMNNKTSACSDKCLKAIVALRSTDQGDTLMGCDCQGSEFCVNSKRRSQEACHLAVEQALDPSTQVSCSTASRICMADQLCSTALGYYYRNCQSLFSLRYCSLQCNNSLAILYRQPKASKLVNCVCDGSEEFPCTKYKTYTEQLCLSKHKTPPPTLVGGDEQKTVNSDSGDDDAEDSEREEFNLTNEPVGNRAASHRATIGAGSSFDANEDEDFHNEDGGGVEEFHSDGYNGIQSIENDWIPLINGRYFTNLNSNNHRQQHQHQIPRPQQQVKQHQPKVKQQRQHQRQRRMQKSAASRHKVPRYSNSAHQQTHNCCFNQIGAGLLLSVTFSITYILCLL